MPAPTVGVPIPPPATYSDDLLRPETRVTWSGATGPTVDVLHEWDTDPGFGSPITDSNTGIAVGAGFDVGVPPSDLGPAGTTWHYRVTVTDNADLASTTSPAETITYIAANLQRRYLYEEVNDGVSFYPVDTTTLAYAADGDNKDFRRYLYEELNDGVGFAYDEPAGGWGAAGTAHPDGDNDLLRRYLYEEQNGGVGFDDNDTPAGGWDPEGTGNPLIGPGDGYNTLFRRYLYEEFGDVDSSTPTPHIWYVFPNFGREGWEFKIVGFGFGDTDTTYAGATARLNALAINVISWVLVAESAATLIIDADTDIAEPAHQEITGTVPTGGESGLIYVEHDDV